MPARRELPKKPRFQYVTERAYAVLLDLGIDHFPISPWKIIEQFSDRIRCLSWSDGRSVLNTDDPFHLHKIGAEARTLRIRNTGIYMIVYDDVRVTNKDRILWTIMHELGHVFCKHLDNFDATALDRGGLTDDENGVLEVEAHFFASEMYAPSAVFSRFTGVTPEEIQLLCGISGQAARKIHKRLYVDESHVGTRMDEKVFRNFTASLTHHLGEMMYAGIVRIWGKPNYTKYLKYCRKCHRCRSFNMDPNAKHCIYCGNSLEFDRHEMTLIEWHNAEKAMLSVPGKDHFSFPERHGYNPEQDSAPGISYCPICMNEEFSPDAKFCRVCGHPLYNVCLEERKLLKCDAHYCPDCGSETSFHRGYQLVEERLKRFQNERQLCHFEDDWLEYPYWDFVQMCISSKGNLALRSALLYSRAFVDDSDGIIVYVLSEKAATIVRDNQQLILQKANKNDTVKHGSLEVYVVNAV